MKAYRNVYIQYCQVFWLYICIWYVWVLGPCQIFVVRLLCCVCVWMDHLQQRKSTNSNFQLNAACMLYLTRFKMLCCLCWHRCTAFFSIFSLQYFIDHYKWLSNFLLSIVSHSAMVILFVDLHNAASSMKVLMRGKPLKTHQKTSKAQIHDWNFLLLLSF